jgi:DedD protein
MAQMEEKKTPQTEHVDDEALRKRLLQRVALAAGVVVILLSGLMYVESTVVRDEKTQKEVARVETPPKPIEKPVEEMAAEEKPGEPPNEKVGDKPAEPVEVAKEPEAEPELTEAPRTVARAERPLTVPARAQQAMVRSGEPVPAPQKKETAKEVVAAPVARLATPPAPASRPITNVVESVRQFMVQAGVFNNITNAEELRAKIDAAGVPARIEARVQVGPFASRQEAEQAREKLKSLGLDPGLIVAARK